MSENIAFLFYKEIYMKYLILYYNWDYGNKYPSSKESSNVFFIILNYIFIKLLLLYEKSLSSDGQKYRTR